MGEVKSITASNEEEQLRLGLGQVLRYAQQLGGSASVVPVLATERCPTDPTWQALCSGLGVILLCGRICSSTSKWPVSRLQDEAVSEHGIEMRRFRTR